MANFQFHVSICIISHLELSEANHMNMRKISFSILLILFINNIKAEEFLDETYIWTEDEMMYYIKESTIDKVSEGVYNFILYVYPTENGRLNLPQKKSYSDYCMERQLFYIDLNTHKMRLTKFTYYSNKGLVLYTYNYDEVLFPLLKVVPNSMSEKIYEFVNKFIKSKEKPTEITTDIYTNTYPEWSYIGASAGDNGDMWYTKTSSIKEVKYGSFGETKCWVKVVPINELSLKNQRQKMYSTYKNVKFLKYAYTLYFYKFRCDNEQIALVNTIDYDTGGNSINSTGESYNSYEDIAPDTIAEKVSNFICDYVKINRNK